MPLLASLNPNIAMHLADLADELHASVPPDVGVPGVPGSLPKRVRQELRALAEKGPSASVALPGGLVARLDQTHTEYVVEKRHLKTRASTISLK